MLIKSEYKLLYSNTPLNALFYATIKTHKEGYPIRPVVSSIEPPTHQLAKFLSKLLAPTSNKAEQKLRNTNYVINCLQIVQYPMDFPGRVRLGAAVWVLDISAPGLSGARIFFLFVFL